nr:MAG TPA: hypothetical protein [Caudoviricetes sp.]
MPSKGDYFKPVPQMVAVLGMRPKMSNRERIGLMSQ